MWEKAESEMKGDPMLTQHTPGLGWSSTLSCCFWITWNYEIKSDRLHLHSLFAPSFPTVMSNKNTKRSGTVPTLNTITTNTHTHTHSAELWDGNWSPFSPWIMKLMNMSLDGLWKHWEWFLTHSRLLEEFGKLNSWSVFELLTFFGQMIKAMSVLWC